MESNHKSNEQNGTSGNRNGARGARPRLADLLESVTIPDEGPAATLPYSNDASNGTNNGGGGVELGGRDKPSATSLGSSSTASTSESSRLSADSSAASEWTAIGGQSKVETASFGDDSLDETLSPAALAAKERREALYSQRQNPSNSARNGHTTQQNGRANQDAGIVDSLADRLFGERQSTPSESSERKSGKDVSLAASLFGTSEANGDSASNGSAATSSLLEPSSRQELDDRMDNNNPADDWTRKFSADAPLPTATDLSTRRSIQEHGVEPTDFRTTVEYSSGSDASDFPNLARPLSDRFSSEQLDSDAPLPDESLSSNSSLNSGRNSGSDVETNSRLERNQSIPQTPQTDPQSTTRRYNTTPPPPSELLNNVSIKGRSDGVSIELGQGKWSDIVEALSQRLVQSTGFFRGGKVTLDVGVRPLQESELREIQALTEQHGLSLTSVRSRSEQSCQLALAAGLAASLDAPDGLLAQPALSNYEKLEHFVYRGNLRSGQILRRSETILVMGDVNPGSQIISDSDILVWGRLRGIAHAGASGDESAVIAALLMEPTQIRISNAIAILPEQEAKISITERFSGGNATPNGIKRPEIAHAIGADIIVDMWDESKPGGIMAFRRSL